MSSEKPLIIDFEYICDFEEEILDPHTPRPLWEEAGISDL